MRDRPRRPPGTGQTDHRDPCSRRPRLPPPTGTVTASARNAPTPASLLAVLRHRSRFTPPWSATQPMVNATMTSTPSPCGVRRHLRPRHRRIPPELNTIYHRSPTRPSRGKRAGHVTVVPTGAWRRGNLIRPVIIDFACARSPPSLGTLHAIPRPRQYAWQLLHYHGPSTAATATRPVRG